MVVELHPPRPPPRAPGNALRVARRGRSSDSGEECVAATERNLKRQTRPAKDHFEKLLEATYPHHSYPIKHKLKYCTLMKKFMMSGAFSKDRKPGGDPGGKGAAPIPGEAKVMTIFDRPHHGPGNTTWLVELQIPDSLR
jgi:hypothetical protein